MQLVTIPLAREGIPFVLACAAAVVLAALWARSGGWGARSAVPALFVALTLFVAYFFRDPKRVTPARDGLVISPADGVVQMITDAAPPSEIEMGESPRTRISIFMNVFNVHVNRIPTGGRIVKTAYRPGRFLNASLDKASEHNERQSFHMETADGRSFGVVQIAGLVARRIRCDLREDQEVQAGERFGIIRFGSRVDVYLPDGVVPLVAVGQTAVAGETVIADLRIQEDRRTGEVR